MIINNKKTSHSNKPLSLSLPTTSATTKCYNNAIINSSKAGGKRTISVYVVVTKGGGGRGGGEILNSYRDLTDTRLRPTSLSGWGCSSVGRASDRHAADACLIPRRGKEFFSQSQHSVQTLLRCPYTRMWNRMHLYPCAR